MICCKIMADFNNKNAKFSDLLEDLGKFGDILWESGVLFFSDINGDITENKLNKIIKKHKYTKCYIDSYTKDNPPRETSDNINAWLLNRLTKIAYNEFENASQELFYDISKGLDVLEHEVDTIIMNQNNNNSSKGGRLKCQKKKK